MIAKENIEAGGIDDDVAAIEMTEIVSVEVFECRECDAVCDKGKGIVSWYSAQLY